MADKLKPCPFCGSEAKLANAVAHYVRCDTCMAFGPTALDDTEAIKLWNTRKEEKEAYNYDALIEDGKTLLNLLDDYENSGGNRGVYAGEKWDKIMRLCKVSFARNVGEADNG